MKLKLKKEKKKKKTKNLSHFTTKFLIIVGLTISFLSLSYGQADIKEIKKEIKKLEKLRAEVKSLIKKNEKLLEKIQNERKALEMKKKALEEYVKQIKDERYKKLAKMFEKMEPELAGEKISNMEDPKKAAYIIYNMKERTAGEVLNYVSPDMVNQITKILTEIKKQKSNQ